MFSCCFLTCFTLLFSLLYFCLIALFLLHLDLPLSLLHLFCCGGFLVVYDIFVELIGRDPSALETHSEAIVCLACCVLIVLGMLFFYRCLDRIFLR